MFHICEARQILWNVSAPASKIVLIVNICFVTLTVRSKTRHTVNCHWKMQHVVTSPVLEELLLQGNDQSGVWVCLCCLIFRGEGRWMYLSISSPTEARQLWVISIVSQALRPISCHSGDLWFLFWFFTLIWYLFAYLDTSSYLVNGCLVYFPCLLYVHLIFLYLIAENLWSHKIPVCGRVYVGGFPSYADFWIC